MGLITIPSDYDERIHSSIVPICIADIDSYGNRLHMGWIENGVVPVADLLRKLSYRVLKDVHRVSEITEHAVHSLSRNHGENLGEAPALRVLKRAHWHAEDLRSGGPRARRRREVELFPATLDALQDQYDLAAALAAKDMLSRLMDQLDRLQLNEVQEMVDMMLRDCEAEDFTNRFGKSRNTISQQFYRGMRKAAKAAGIWPQP